MVELGVTVEGRKSSLRLIRLQNRLFADLTVEAARIMKLRDECNHRVLSRIGSIEVEAQSITDYANAIARYAERINAPKNVSELAVNPMRNTGKVLFNPLWGSLDGLWRKRPRVLSPLVFLSSVFSYYSIAASASRAESDRLKI